jgi:protein phosphatase
MRITIPDASLVILAGTAGCGKSTFARKHFRATEVLSSDSLRAMISDDESSQAVNRDVFEVLHLLVAKRLAHRRFTVVDATNVRPDARQELLAIARKYHYLTTAIVFNLSEEVSQQRNRERSEQGGREVLPAVVHLHTQQLQQAIQAIKHERFHQVWVLSSPEEIEAVEIVRERMPFDHTEDRGPFDIIGDVHGCFEELTELLGQLGYSVVARSDETGRRWYAVRPPEERKAVFVGDLVDRGPQVPEVLRLVMDMSQAGVALCVVGNHDDKFLRHLKGNAVAVKHGLAETLLQMEKTEVGFRERTQRFLECLPSHLVLDGGQLVIAHAGLRQDLQGRASKRVRDFALYGETSGEVDEFGLPVRGDWGAEYKGSGMVVYGHTPVVEPAWQNRTINIDTGCVFGGKLTALRFPEGQLVSVPARQVYIQHARSRKPAESAPSSDGLPAAPAGETTLCDATIRPTTAKECPS